jgi:hypothetical protein
MRIFVGKPVNFVFNGRTVPGTHAFDDAGIERRAVKSGADNVVCFRICIRYMAGNLYRVNAFIIQIRKYRDRILIAVLNFAL